MTNLYIEVPENKETGFLLIDDKKKTHWLKPVTTLKELMDEKSIDFNKIIQNRYPFYNEDLAMKDIELNAEQVKVLMEDLLKELFA